MFCRPARPAAFFLLFVSALTSGCSRSESRRFERLALLPFENLSDDAQLDWLTYAIPGTLSLQLAPSPNLNATNVGSPRDVPGVRATRALYGYFTNVGGRLRITAELRDAGKQTTLQTIEASAERGGGILPLIDRIARELFAEAQPAARRNEAAIREYWLGVTASDPAAGAQALARAIAADPGFAPPHLAIIQSRYGAGDAAGAAAAVKEARRHAAAFTPLEKARLDLAEARVRGDAAATLRALTALTRITPANDDLWRSVADLELARRNFPAAATAYERSIERDPGSVVALNTLAYTRAFAGDLEGAKRALERYTEVAPGDANVQDTFGDVHFYLGRFAEAEKYYLEAHRLNPGLLAGGDLYRAALAAWFAGDPRRADSHFANWLALRKRGNDPLLVVREAVWEASTGRLPQARTRLRQLTQETGPGDEPRLAAAAQLAIFDKAAGEHPVVPPARANPSAAVAGFLCQPDASPAVWSERASTLPPALRPVLLGYALLLNGKFREAVPVWRTAWQAAHPTTDSDLRIMLSWALTASGEAGEARRLLAHAPLPGRAAEPGLTFLTIQKFAELRPRESSSARAPAR